MLKNNFLRAFFTTDKNSNYFESIEFKKIMNFLRENPKDCQIKENRGKLSLRKEGVIEINQALELFNKLMSQKA